MKVLVTGAAGFIGFHLAGRLAERGDDIVGVDSLNDYYDPRLKLARLGELGIPGEEAVSGRETASSRFPRLSFRRLSLEDAGGMEELFARHRFDRVCNLAAQAGVRYSLENPRAYVEANVLGFLNVLECCRKAGVAHLVYASSSSIYGLDGAQPFSVHMGASHPASVYAATKKADELLAHAYSHLYGLPTTGLRFFTVYGPWGRPDMAYYKFARAIAEGRPIEVYNNGNMRRDFTYIDDVVDGVCRVLDGIPSADPAFDPERPDPAVSSAPYRIYNIGNSAPMKLGDFVEALELAMGAKAEKRYLPMQPGDVLSTEADVSDLARDFGWRPSTPVASGLARFAAWFAAHRDLAR